MRRWYFLPCLLSLACGAPADEGFTPYVATASPLPPAATATPIPPPTEAPTSSPTPTPWSDSRVTGVMLTGPIPEIWASLYDEAVELTEQILDALVAQEKLEPAEAAALQ